MQRGLLLLCPELSKFVCTQTLPSVPGINSSGTAPNCPYTKALELAKKQLAHEDPSLDFSKPAHAAALTRLAMQHDALRPRLTHASTLSVLQDSGVSQVCLPADYCNPAACITGATSHSACMLLAPAPWGWRASCRFWSQDPIHG